MMRLPPLAHMLRRPGVGRWNLSEAIGESICGRWAVLGVLREASKPQPVERRGDLELGALRGRNGSRLGVLKQRVDHRASREDQLAGHQPVGETADSIVVKAHIDRTVSERLVWRHERGRPTNRSLSAGERDLASLCLPLRLHQAEVEYFDEV